MNTSESRPLQSKLTFILLQIVIVLLAVAVGFFSHRFIAQYRGELGLLRQAREILLNNTILELPPEPNLEYGMIRGMLEAVGDPYTYFVEPAVHEIQSDQLTGSFGGVGVRLERDTDSNWRLYPLPDSPAMAAGVADGDLLLQVENLEITSDLEETTILAAIRGEKGRPVSLTVLRDGQILHFTIKRQSVPLPSVTWNLVPEAPDIGLVQIHTIASTTAEEIEDALNALQEAGATAFILDFRNNGGGLVEAGIDIAELFLEKGILLERQFKGQDVETFTVEEPGPFPGIPLVVLVNGRTASSAEIITGALQVHGRALLIGSPTFGKTTIQYVFDLQDGSSLHVTSGAWWIPGQTFPLAPDISVGEDPTGVESLQAGIEALSTRDGQ